MSIIRTVDSATLNLIPTAENVMEAVKYGDHLGAVQAGLEHISGYFMGANYVSTALDKGAISIIELTKQLPITIDPKVMDVLQGITLTQVIGGLAIGINALSIASNSILIYRDSKVLENIPGYEELGTQENLQKTLEDLEKMNYNHFKKTLPEYLRTKVENYGNKNIFTTLKAADKTDEARDLLLEIKDHVNRSRVMHILTLIGSTIGLIAAIGLFAAFPPMLLLALSLIGIAITITCAIMQKTWVENPDQGVNLKLLLPEFIRKKLDAEPADEVEMVNFSTGITPQIQLTPTNLPEDPPMPLRVDEASTAEPTRWEKLTAWFRGKESTENQVGTEQGTLNTTANRT